MLLIIYVKKRIAKVLNMLIFTMLIINGIAVFGSQNQSGKSP